MTHYRACTLQSLPYSLSPFNFVICWCKGTKKNWTNQMINPISSNYLQYLTLTKQSVMAFAGQPQVLQSPLGEMLSYIVWCGL
jgi:hypothetical protein